MAKYIKFTVGGFFDGYKSVEIAIVRDTATYKILRSGLLDIGKKKSLKAKISDEWLKELNALKIFDWAEKYSAEILDGTQWELIFKDGEKIYRGYGSNDYPENWEKFLDWLDELVPELELVNRKRLEKITLNYSREDKIFEMLTLDRRDKTLRLDKRNSVHIYNLDADIKKIFDDCQDFLDELEIEDANVDLSTRIKFELALHDGSIKTFETFYNENFLPGLTTLLEKIHTFADDLTAEIFSPASAAIVKSPCKYIFCKVQFKGSYKHYTYSTDDEKLSIGDVVDVPVGRNNDVAQAKIVDIGYFDEYEAPFPVDRIKKIIGKHIADEWENY